MARGPAIAHVKGLRLSLGGAPLFDDVSFVLHKGERTAFVGANGAGKSTLMHMLARYLEPDAGEISYASGAAIAFAAQEPCFDGFATLLDFARAPPAPGGAIAPAYAAEAELSTLGLDPARAPDGLSGGEMRRAALARAFAAEADILLLDEPTNHLDIAAIQALEQRLAGFRGAALVISHDRRFLERVSTSMLWLRQRRVLESPRGFEAFEEWAAAIELEEERALARLETNLRAEEHWLRRGVTARRARNEGRRRKLEAMRADKRARGALAASGSAVIQAERGAESARLVVEARAVSKAYGGQPLIVNFSMRLMRGDRLGIVGPNGAGKSTLLEILLRRRAPDQGEVRLGENLFIAYVDQGRALLNASATLGENLAPLGGDQIVVRGQARHIAAYARDFLFKPEQLRQPVAALSGGERNRLALAVALARPANLLVLDEPTNDLDMETLDALEETLAHYDGAVIIVSHDRAFLDGVATQIVGPLGGGKWAETPGGWADFEREHGGFSFKKAQTLQTPAKPDAPPQRQSRKLSYKEERRAAELDDKMGALTAFIADAEAKFANPAGLDDARALETAAAQLAAARSELEAAEAEWLAIELKREQLASEL